MRRMCAFVAVSLTASTGLPAATATTADDPAAERVRQILTVPPGPIAPGCAAGVFDGEGARTFTSGYADLANRRPIDSDTQFYVASITKQFTALAIAKLVLAGRLSMQDDVRRWIPEMRRYRVPVTISMLVHHTAGIRDPIALLRLSGYADFADMDRRDAVALVARQSDTDFTPGTRYEYSNGGYLLLAEVVTRASGLDYARFVERSILKPLEMTRSFVLDGARPTGPDVARGYVRDGDQYALRDTYPLYGGPGGLMTTINDMGRFHRDVTVAHRVWTPEIAALLEAPGRLSDGRPVAMSEIDAVYAGGLMLHGRWIEHGGDAEGFKAEYARLRDRPLGIAVFCNRGDVAPVDKADAILRVMADRVPSLRSPPTPPSWANGIFKSPDLPARYSVVTADGRMTITRVPDDANVRASGPIVLKRLIDGSFASDDGRMRVVEDGGGDGFVVDNWRASGIRFHRVSG